MTPRPVSWLPGSPSWPVWSAYQLQLALALALGVAFVLLSPALARVARLRLLTVVLAAALVGLAGALWIPWLVAGMPRYDAPSDLQLVAYAGAAAGALAAAVAANVLSVPVRTLFDALAPIAALGLALARIGCFLAGCDYGTSSAAWSAVRYPAWAFPYEPRPAAAALADHVAKALVAPSASASLPVHPVQLYESLLGLVLFAVLLRAGPRRDGLRPLLLALGYGLGRFLLEFLRGDDDRGIRVLATPWSASQCASLAAVALAGGILLWRGRTRNPLT